MKNLTGRLMVGALVLALVVSALPMGSTYAAGLNDTATPPAPGKKVDPARVTARLENVFFRQQQRVERIGHAIDNFERTTADIQKLIDKASANGKDVRAVQSAFDAFKAAFPKGEPIHDRAQSIVEKHAGFDAAGKVTEIESARATVKELAGVLKEYHSTVGEFFKALREAVRAFRQANPRPTPTPGA